MFSMKYTKCILIEISIVCYALIHADVLNPASSTSNCYFTYFIKIPDFETFLYDRAGNDCPGTFSE